MTLRERIHHRSHRTHQHEHAVKQRRTALILIYTALARVSVWVVLTILYLIGVTFAVTLFKSVAFVALISMFALILTDWGQFAASMAQLTAGDVGHVVTTQQQVDTDEIQRNLAELAELQPGPEARTLAAKIREQIAG
jgi:hypothetical protein